MLAAGLFGAFAQIAACSDDPAPQRPPSSRPSPPPTPAPTSSNAPATPDVEADDPCAQTPAPDFVAAIPSQAFALFKGEAFVVGDQEIRAISLDGSGERVVGPVSVAAEVERFAVDDGGVYFTQRASGLPGYTQLMKLPLAGGNSERVDAPPDAEDRRLQGAPLTTDGTFVYTVDLAWPANVSAYRVDKETGEITKLANMLGTTVHLREPRRWPILAQDQLWWRAPTISSGDRIWRVALGPDGGGAVESVFAAPDVSSFAVADEIWVLRGGAVSFYSLDGTPLSTFTPQGERFPPPEASDAVRCPRLVSVTGDRALVETKAGFEIVDRASAHVSVLACKSAPSFDCNQGVVYEQGVFWPEGSSVSQQLVTVALP